MTAPTHSKRSGHAGTALLNTSCHQSAPSLRVPVLQWILEVEMGMTLQACRIIVRRASVPFLAKCSGLLMQKRCAGCGKGIQRGRGVPFDAPGGVLDL